MKGHKAVFGIYGSEPSVADAVDSLKVAAYRADDISILKPAKAGSPEFAFEKKTKAKKNTKEK